ncbi:MAG: hypothetical protein KGL44_01970 [Sphingomonadales bacterium]|nr:hypothetical protein [Sphingomonadales bacterium]
MVDIAALLITAPAAKPGEAAIPPSGETPGNTEFGDLLAALAASVAAPAAEPATTAAPEPVATRFVTLRQLPGLRLPASGKTLPDALPEAAIPETLPAPAEDEHTEADRPEAAEADAVQPLAVPNALLPAPLLPGPQPAMPQPQANAASVTRSHTPASSLSNVTLTATATPLPLPVAAPQGAAVQAAADQPVQPAAQAPQALPVLVVEPSLPSASVQAAVTLAAPQLAQPQPGPALPGLRLRPLVRAAAPGAGSAPSPLGVAPQSDAPRPLVASAEAQPLAALAMPATPAQPGLEAVPATAPRSEAPQDFAALVDRLVQAREAAGPQVVQASVTHADFGHVSLRFEHDNGGLSVAMASADPAFARAAQAAIPSVAPPQTASDARGSDSGSSSGRQDQTGQGSANHAATGQQARSSGEDPRQSAASQRIRAQPARATTAESERQRGGIFA